MFLLQQQRHQDRSHSFNAKVSLIFVLFSPQLVKENVNKFVNQELEVLLGTVFPQCSGSQGGGGDEEAVDAEEEKQKKSAIKGVGKITLLCLMRMKEEELVHSLKSGKRLI